MGTAAGTGVALSEGMVSYLDDQNRLEIYTGSSWAQVMGFTAGTAITASDASWAVPTLRNSIVRVTVIGGGGGGGGGASGGGGGTTTFDAGAAGTVSATGGPSGKGGETNTSGGAGSAGFAAGNGGVAGSYNVTSRSGTSGGGGAITVAYLDLTGISTVNVTIGAGGTGGATSGSTLTTGGAGGRGEVIFEYVAG